MASEDKKQNDGAMPAKQKATIAVIAVVFLIIGWQILQLFSGGSSATTQKMVQKQTVINKELKLASSSASPVARKTNEDEISVHESSISNDSKFKEMQRRVEEKYIGRLSELEQLRLQRQIAETNQAISAAKLATVTAEKDISNLLTAPTTQQTKVQQLSEYSQQIQQAAEVKAKKAIEEEEEKNKIPDAKYSLVSVSKSLNKWQAVLSLGDRLYGVRVGDTLPPDGSKVTGISARNIFLERDGKKRTINIVASVLTSELERTSTAGFAGQNESNDSSSIRGDRP